MNLLIKQKQTHRLREWAYGCRGEGIFRESGIDMYTLLYLKWMTNKDLLCGTGKSAQCYMAAWMGGEFGREWIHSYVWLSPFTVQLKLLQLCAHVCVCVCERERERERKREKEREWLSHVWLFVTPWTVACQFLCPWNSPGQNTGLGNHSLLQQIFPTQGVNPGLLHLRVGSLPAELSQYKIKSCFFFFFFKKRATQTK